VLALLHYWLTADPEPEKWPVSRWSFKSLMRRIFYEHRSAFARTTFDTALIQGNMFQTVICLAACFWHCTQRWSAYLVNQVFADRIVVLLYRDFPWYLLLCVTNAPSSAIDWGNGDKHCNHPSLNGRYSHYLTEVSQKMIKPPCEATRSPGNLWGRCSV